MSLPWLPTTRILLLEPGGLRFVKLRRAFTGAARVLEEKLYPLADGDQGLVDALAVWKNDFHPGIDDLLLLGLGLDYFTVLDFILPAAAAENLEDAVGYELMRHLPVDPAAYHWRYRVHEEDGQLAVRVILAERSRVDGCLNAFVRAGISLSAIFPSLFLRAWMLNQAGLYLGGGDGSWEMLLFDGRTVLFQVAEKDGADGYDFLCRNLPLAENRGQSLERVFLDPRLADWQSWIGELRPRLEIVCEERDRDLRFDWNEFPYSIDLISPQVLQRRRLWFKLEVAAALFLLVALAGQPVAVLAGKQRRLGRLEKKLEQVRQQADKLSGLRRENQAKIDRIENLARLLQEQPVVIDLLKELTEVIPHDTWLDSLSYRAAKLHLRGTSASATAVVKALEDSPLFKEVHFDSPVVKRGNSETFKIVVDLE